MNRPVDARAPTVSPLLDLGIPPEEILALEQLSEATEACVFATGSSVEGMARRCSDIDVFVVGTAAPVGQVVQRDGEAVVSVHLVESRPVDFQFWQQSYFEALAARVDAINLEGAWVHGAQVLARRFDERELLVIHRVRTGIPLLHAGRFERLRSMFDFDKLAKLLVALRMRELDPILADVQGMLALHDVEFAIPRARELQSAACDVFLHSMGITSVKRKWRGRLLESCRGAQADEVRAKYWELQLADAARCQSDRAAYEDYLAESISFANRITNWIV